MFRTITLFLFCIINIRSQSLDDQLRRIEYLGNYLFQYYDACRMANDKISSAQVTLLSFNSYYAQKIGNLWKIGYGRYGEASNEYLLSYEVTYSPSNGECSLTSYTEPIKEKDFYCHAAKMDRIISKIIDNNNGPYSIFVIPIDSAQWYLYALPTQTDKELYRLGGDNRFTVNFRNDEITDNLRLHKSVMLMPYKSSKVQNTMSSALMSRTPVESDILYVLLRNFKSKHEVITKNYIYIIDEKGEISKLPASEGN